MEKSSGMRRKAGTLFALIHLPVLLFLKYELRQVSMCICILIYSSFSLVFCVVLDHNH